MAPRPAVLVMRVAPAGTAGSGASRPANTVAKVGSFWSDEVQRGWASRKSIARVEMPAERRSAETSAEAEAHAARSAADAVSLRNKTPGRGRGRFMGLGFWRGGWGGGAPDTEARL